MPSLLRMAQVAGDVVGCFRPCGPQKRPFRFRPDHAMKCELRRAAFMSAHGGGPDLQAASLLQPPSAQGSGWNGYQALDLDH